MSWYAMRESWSVRRGAGLGVAKLFIVGVLCFASVGCSGDSYWYHPDRSLAEAEEDCRRCYQRAQVQASEITRDQRLDRAAAPSELDGEQWSYAYQDAQFRRCMKDAGYEFVPAKQLDKDVQKRVLRLGAFQSFPIAGD